MAGSPLVVWLTSEVEVSERNVNLTMTYTEFSSYVPKNIFILLVSGIMMNKVKYL